jgi:hypothetical protein
VYIDQNHTPSPSLFTLPTPNGTHPWYHFLECMLTGQGGFTLVFYTCAHMYRSSVSVSILYFNQVNPLLLTLSLLPCSPIIQQPSLYTDAMYFDTVHYHSLFTSCLPQFPQTDPLLQLFFSLCHSLYMCMYV